MHIEGFAYSHKAIFGDRQSQFEVFKDLVYFMSQLLEFVFVTKYSLACRYLASITVYYNMLRDKLDITWEKNGGREYFYVDDFG